MHCGRNFVSDYYVDADTSNMLELFSLTIYEIFMGDCVIKASDWGASIASQFVYTVFMSSIN